MDTEKSIPDLENLLNAIACSHGLYVGNKCEKCPFGYSYYDDSGDYGFWRCDEQHFDTDILFYLYLYKYLIDEDKKKNDTM